MWEVPIYVYVQAPNAGRAISLVEDVARGLTRRRVVVSVSVGLAQRVRSEP